MRSSASKPLEVETLRKYNADGETRLLSRPSLPFSFLLALFLLRFSSFSFLSSRTVKRVNGSSGARARSNFSAIFKERAVPRALMQLIVNGTIAIFRRGTRRNIRGESRETHVNETRAR